MESLFYWSDDPCESPRSWRKTERKELENKNSVPDLEGQEFVKFPIYWNVKVAIFDVY